jgi:fatty acid CoA ligase FadD9
MSTEDRGARLARRIADLYETDPQFSAARPDDSVSAAIDSPDLSLHEIAQTVMAGYAQRPALGQRATRLVNGADGRTTVELLGEFDTITYRGLWDRAGALAAAMTDLRLGDRVCMLGFNSVDYTVVDVALIRAAAVSVPLQTSAPIRQIRPIVEETEPAVIAAAVDYLDDAVEVALSAHMPRRLVVFDYRPEVDSHRDALHAAIARLSGSPVVVETLAELVERGRTLPAAQPVLRDGDDLALLIYTSGSTGTPKGAMYPDRMVAHSWLRSSRAAWGDASHEPAITLNFLPMSHVMGRANLYATLGAGGTA